MTTRKITFTRLNKRGGGRSPSQSKMRKMGSDPIFLHHPPLDFSTRPPIHTGGLARNDREGQLRVGRGKPAHFEPMPETSGENRPRMHHRALCAVGWSLPAVAGTDRAPLRPARWLRRATARNVAGRNGARTHHHIGMRRGQKGGQKAPIRGKFRQKSEKKSKKPPNSALPILTFRPLNRLGASARPDLPSKTGQNPPKPTQNRPPTHRPCAICARAVRPRPAPAERPLSPRLGNGGHLCVLLR